MHCRRWAHGTLDARTPPRCRNSLGHCTSRHDAHAMLFMVCALRPCRGYSLLVAAHIAASFAAAAASSLLHLLRLLLVAAAAAVAAPAVCCGLLLLVLSPPACVTVARESI